MHPRNITRTSYRYKNRRYSQFTVERRTRLMSAAVTGTRRPYIAVARCEAARWWRTPQLSFSEATHVESLTSLLSDVSVTEGYPCTQDPQRCPSDCLLSFFFLSCLECGLHTFHRERRKIETLKASLIPNISAARISIGALPMSYSNHTLFYVSAPSIYLWFTSKLR